MGWGMSAGLSALSGTALALAFPGADLWPLAWVALVPLLVALRRSSLPRAFLLGHLAGFLYFCGILWWGLAVDGYNPLNFTLQNFVCGLWIGLFAFVAAFLHSRLPRWDSLTIPAVWVLVEHLRSHVGFLSWPWGILGYAQHSFLPAAATAAYAGVSGVSFLVVAANTALADLARPAGRGADTPRATRMRAAWALGAVAAVTAGAFLVPGGGEPSARPAAALRVSLLQGNVLARERDDTRFREAIFETYESLSLEAAAERPDLIVWPSSSVPGTIPAERAWVDLLGNLARRTGAWLLVGSSGFDKLDPRQRREGRVSNSAFLFSPEGRIVGRYDKMRLLPFDEYLPLRGQVRWPAWVADPRMTDARPGEALTVFRLGERRFGALICWENYFPEQARDLRDLGGEFLVSMTNEGFTSLPAAHRQMFAMNVLRAVEAGLPVVRTASTGISAIIAPSGRIVGRVRGEDGRDTGVAGHTTVALPAARGRTFYQRHGDWVVWISALVLPVAAIGALARRGGAA